MNPRLRTAAAAALIVCASLPGRLSAADCEPDLDAEVLIPLVQQRSHGALVDALRKGVGASAEFEAAHGAEGLDESIEALVSELLAQRGDDAPKLATVQQQNDLLQKLKGGIEEACKSLAAGESDDEAREKALQAADLAGGDSQFYALLGTVNSLEGDGRFASGLEASLISTTDFKAGMLPVVPNDKKTPLTGTFEITFSEIGSIEDEDNMAAPDPVNPFAVGGGFVRLNMSLDWYLSDGNRYSGIGLRAGGGFSTLPSEAESDVDTRGRGYVGLVFRANYGTDKHGRRGRGEVFLGMAKDKFWNFDRVVDDSTMPPSVERIKASERMVVDARIDVPKVFESDAVRLNARVFADIPASGDGPSDIRVSLLLTVNLGAFFPVN